MTVDAVVAYVLGEFDGVVATEASGDTFFAYDPHGDLPDDRWNSFATVVTGDRYDSVSRLDRDGAYRLNLGLPTATYRTLFGAPPSRRDDDGVFDTGFDYGARDRVMPHPFYASQGWVCVVSPGEATFEAVVPLLTEAYDFAVRKYANQRARP